MGRGNQSVNCVKSAVPNINLTPTNEHDVNQENNLIRVDLADAQGSEKSKIQVQNQNVLKIQKQRIQKRVGKILAQGSARSYLQRLSIEWKEDE